MNVNITINASTARELEKILQVLKPHCHEERVLETILSKLEAIMATQAQVTADLNAVKDQLVKIGGETSSLLTKIDELLAIIANGPVSAELQAAVDAVKAQAAVVDALVPDAP